MIAKHLKLAAVALFMALAAPAAAQTNVDEAERGIVRIVVILDSPEGPMLYGSGSGFVVAPNRVVTNAHVVAAARQRPEFGVAVVPPHGDGLLTARIVFYQPLLELALLEFSGGDDLPALTISTVSPNPGDAVLALGYPDVDYQGASGADLLRPTPASRTSGRIAALRDRAPTGDQIPTINHEAVISSGSSGGPLLDECGRVLGVNAWHVSGADTRETRGVSTRAAQLLQFLDEAGISPNLSDERCLPLEARVAAERQATIGALEQQNEELAKKLETADRLTRIAVVILMAGTLALFVAVVVLGAVVLGRRPRAQHADAPAEGHLELHEQHAPRRRLGIVAVVLGASAAAVLVVLAGAALWRAQGQNQVQIADTPRFAGQVTCTLDRDASIGAQGFSDMAFTASGALCVNERTLYAPTEDGRFQRAIVMGEARTLDMLTIDPASGELRRERYPLSEADFASANQAVAESGAGRGCQGEGASDAVARRNAALARYAQSPPRQRVVWRCEARGG